MAHSFKPHNLRVNLGQALWWALAPLSPVFLLVHFSVLFSHFKRKGVNTF